MKGILITKKEGLPKDSVIKLNYIFTISERMVKKFFDEYFRRKKAVNKKRIN